MSHFGYHYTHVVRSLLIDKRATLPAYPKLTLSVSSNALIHHADLVGVVLSVLEMLTGKKGEIVRFKQSISNFSMKKGMVSGGVCHVDSPELFKLLDPLLYWILPSLRKKGSLLTFQVGLATPLIFFPTIHASFPFGLYLSLC